MKWPWQQGKDLVRTRTALLDESDDDLEAPHNSKPRGSVLQEPMTIKTMLSNAWSPFENLDALSENADIERSTLEDLKDGITLGDLIRSHPDDVLTVLKKVSVAPLGTMEAKDSQVLAAFGRESMLTLGSDDAQLPTWQSKWRNALEKKGGSDSHHISIGWEQNVTVGAYVVNVADIAKKTKDADLIDLLLQKYAAGAAPREIWEFPAVEAVINYHWQNWAKHALSIVFGLFVLWILCFFTYGMLFVQYYVPIAASVPANATAAANATTPANATATPGPRPSPAPDNVSNFLPFAVDNRHAAHGGGSSSHHPVPHPTTGDEPTAPAGPPRHRLHNSFTNRVVIARVSDALNIACLIIMGLFAVEEFWTVITLRLNWISIGNFIDMMAILCQVGVSIHHYCNFDGELYGYLIALQTVMLSIRLLRFVKYRLSLAVRCGATLCRLLAGGTTFLDTALNVIYNVRYWLAYMVFTGVSASIALSAIYRTDEKFTHDHTEFRTPFHALVTTFHIMFADFASVYVLDARKQFIAFLFLLGFQVVMSITILNLIIASMTDSYSTMSLQKISQHYKSRAELIDELQSLYLPRFLIRNPPTYIHFLVVEKNTVVSDAASSVGPGDVVQQASFAKMRSEISRDYYEALCEKIDALATTIEEMKKKKRESFQDRSL